MLESLNWTFVVCFFLSLLNKQAGQTFISNLGGPGTEAEVSQTHRIKHTGETNIDYCWPQGSERSQRSEFLLITKPHTSTDFPRNTCSGREKLPIVLINVSATPLFLHSPHPSFFFRLVPITRSAGFFSAFHLHLSCLKPFNGVNCWGNNGADRWDQSNLQSICMGKMETIASRLLGFRHCVSTQVFKIPASTLLITIPFPGMLGCSLKSQ